jgi:hypothetical protein
MAYPPGWQETDYPCPNCEKAKLLAKDAPPMPVLQPTSHYDDQKLWRCSDPECYADHGEWIDGV